MNLRKIGTITVKKLRVAPDPGSVGTGRGARHYITGHSGSSHLPNL